MLLVEDEALIRLLAVEYLQEAGFTVDGASTATEAINKLSLVPGGVDAVILDIGLPDRRGDILVREIRAIHPSLPIVLATGQGSHSLRDAFKNDPHIAFVEKPYNASDLAKGLRSVGFATSRDN